METTKNDCYEGEAFSVGMYNPNTSYKYTYVAVYKLSLSRITKKNNNNDNNR